MGLWCCGFWTRLNGHMVLGAEGIPEGEGGLPGQAQEVQQGVPVLQGVRGSRVPSVKIDISPCRAEISN